MKHYHRLAVDSAARISGSINFSRADFLAALPEIRRNALKPHTIQSGWRKAGIIPFNPSMVLDQLESDDDRSSFTRPCTPDPDHPSSDPVTPRTVRTFTRIQRRMEGILDRGESPPSPLARRMGRGAVELAFAHELLEKRCKDMTATARGRDRRAGGMRQRTGFGGMMEAGTGRAINMEKSLQQQAKEKDRYERMMRRDKKWDEQNRKREQRETDRAERELRDSNAEKARETKKNERERKKAMVASAKARRAKERQMERLKRVPKDTKRSNEKLSKQRRDKHAVAQKDVVEQGCESDRSEDLHDDDRQNTDQQEVENPGDAHNEEDEGYDEDYADEEINEDVEADKEDTPNRDHDDDDNRAGESSHTGFWDHEFEEYQMEENMEIEESYSDSGSRSDDY